MNRILVMEEGHLIEQGTHRELIALGGNYFRMFSPNGVKPTA
jgi:ABC-type multidrug transport system fused ATPase/permease subunit